MRSSLLVSAHLTRVCKHEVIVLFVEMWSQRHGLMVSFKTIYLSTHEKIGRAERLVVREFHAKMTIEAELPFRP